MIKLDIKQAHKLVREQRAIGVDCEWDGWDIVFYRPAEHAMHSPDGVFRNGQWAFANRHTVNSDGIWEIDQRNVKRVRRSRSGRG